MFSDKRGLSEVVVAVIMIVLVLAAIGIIWVVVKNVLTKGSEQIGGALEFVTLDIENVQVKDDGTILVGVKRTDTTEADVSKIKLFFSDGTDQESKDFDAILGPLDKKTFDGITLTDLAYANEISVAPIVKTSDGTEKLREITDKYEVAENNVDVVKLFFRPVSWWRMEGDASDEAGGNDGLATNVEFVDGEYGKALDSTNSFQITFDFTNPITISNGYTTIFRVNIPSPDAPHDMILQLTANTNKRFWVTNYPSFTSTNPFFLFTNDEGVGSITTISAPFTTNSGVFIALTVDNTGKQQLYVNNNAPVLGNSAYSLGNPITQMKISDPSMKGFNGKIDEVMLFNRALSENEVKALYELDLS
ncbi:MAG TPA: LamG-like jellyroll fold domain-containing protein [Candidatus Nanoarchaeia archaeon]|nr:LamG-like jellyroll fold domain-containing protein [Candidatus Nanoarchaeia archaeon]